MRTRKTIVAIRIKGRTAFELLTLFKMFFVIGILMGMMFGCQVYFCKKEHNGKPWTECFNPYASVHGR